MTSDAAGVREPQSGWSRAGLHVAIMAAVAVAALIVGGVTSPAQGFLPDAFRSFANSASGWTILAFVIVWLSRLRPLLAGVAGALAFVLMVEGYRIVSEWRGFGYGAPFQDIFTYIGLLVGPVVGAGAGLLRYGSPLWRVLSIGPLVVVMIGDGIYGLTVVADTTSPVYWWTVIVLGVGIALAHLRHQRPPVRVALLFAGLVVAGVAAYWGAFQLLNLVMMPPTDW